MSRADAPRPPKARSDAYVGLLSLALVAQLVGAIFLYLDYSSFGTMAPPKLQAAPGSQAGPAPAGPAGPPPAPPAPPPMPMQ